MKVVGQQQKNVCSINKTAGRILAAFRRRMYNEWPGRTDEDIMAGGINLAWRGKNKLELDEKLLFYARYVQCWSVQIGSFYRQIQLLLNFQSENLKWYNDKKQFESIAVDQDFKGCTLKSIIRRPPLH